MVQWIRICLPVHRRGQLFDPGWEDATFLRATKPVRHNYWAQMWQLLKPELSLEPVLHNERSHWNEKPWQWHPTPVLLPGNPIEEPGRLQSMGSLRVGHDWATSLSLFTFMHWRRKWQPTAEFLPGESQGWGSLVGCCLWGHTKSDTTEAT